MGRYDVKANSLEDLLNGNFGILELNNFKAQDHRASIKTMSGFDKDNYIIQLRWFFKRLLIGTQNNIKGNTFKIIYNLVNQFRTMCKEDYEGIFKIVKSAKII